MRYIVMAMLMVLACLDLSTAQAAASDDERESLRELPCVTVLIEGIEPDAQADGLTKEAVQTTVELILRSSGIRLLTGPEWLKTPSSPFLYVQVGTVKSGLTYAVTTRVSLSQQVSLVHRPERRMWADTWSHAKTGILSRNNLRSIMPDAVEPLVKAFANDFLAVNPR